jgi:hypothetical protein
LRTSTPRGTSSGRRQERLQALQEGAEAGQLLLVEVAELQGATEELRSQLPGGGQEGADLLPAIDQHLLVGDDLGHLEGEAEAVRRPIAPALDHLAAGAAVEGAVYLDDRETLGVEREKAGGLQVGRVEDGGPVLVRPAAGADTDGVHRGDSLRRGIDSAPGRA